MRVTPLLGLLAVTGRGLAATPCSFKGPDVEQAACLLRPVATFGEVGASPASLPAPLDRLVGTPVAITANALRAYLVAHGVREADIGGPLAAPVSRTSDGTPARYFIIHDTSAPTIAHGAPFPPADMDDPRWTGNDLGRWVNVPQPAAHVFVDRAGRSATGHDFNVGWRSTKYEMQGTSRRGLFLAVENIQPRRIDAHGIDSEAPTPGFSDAQLDRLALVYVAASVRAGRWLIPAFHAVIDVGVAADTHDDPQHFDLGRWGERVGALVEAVGR